MRLNFDRFRRQLGDGRFVLHVLSVRVDVMKRCVRVSERGLFEVLVDAASSALIFRFQLDCNARAAHDVDPIERAFREQRSSFVVCGNLLAVAVAVENLWRIGL